MCAWNHLWNHKLISWVHKTSFLLQTHDGLLISGFGHPSRLNRYPMTNANLWHLPSSWVPISRIESSRFVYCWLRWLVCRSSHFSQIRLEMGVSPYWSGVTIYYLYFIPGFGTLTVKLWTLLRGRGTSIAIGFVRHLTLFRGLWST